MTHFEVALPEVVDWNVVASVVGASVMEEGLTVTMLGTLKAFPGSTHWHLKRGSERGTLEVTAWPAERRLWLSIQAGRTAEWAEETAPRMAHALGAILGTR